MNVLKKRIFGMAIGAILVTGIIAVMAVAVWSWLKPKAQEALGKAGLPGGTPPPTPPAA